MSDEITREVSGAKGRYVIRRPEGEAEMTFSVLTPDRIIVDHTEVPKALEGQGLARALLTRLLADAEAQGFTIVPLCPYVAGQARRHPEWAHLFKV